MNSNIKTKSQAQDSARDAVSSLSRSSLIVMGGVSGIVGLWAVACLVSALVQNGPVEMVRGFVTALIGV